MIPVSFVALAIRNYDLRLLEALLGYRKMELLKPKPTPYMRNLLLLPALGLSMLAHAQGNQGWTATDTQGNSHTLQTYLNDGKSVLVDLSAHWCGPCWAWHNSGIMDKLMHEFGPDGTDDLRILFIDGSSQPPSTLNLLNGVGQTQGNWLAGTNYPIIGPGGQGQLVANNYNFPGFPTLFLHCPGSNSGVEIARKSTWQSFFSTWRNGCLAPFNNGVNDATLLRMENTTLCPGQNPKVELFNMGSAVLGSARIEMFQGGTLLQTVNWTGTLDRWQSTFVEFDNINLVSGATYTATVSLPNGATDEHLPGNSEDYTYTVAPTAATATINLELRTDNYASETTWKLFDSNNNQVSQNGTLANATTVNTWWNLNPNECYRFEVYDSYGDGFCCSYGQGFYRIKSNGVIVSQGGQFGGVDKVSFMTGAAVGMEENVLENGFSVFPNPSNGLVNLQFELPNASTVEFVVTNMLGEQVMSRSSGASVGRQQISLDMSGLAEGSYFVSLRADGMVATRKVTLTH